MPPHPGTSTTTSTSSSGPYVRPPAAAAPYMVALSGWPEPVYISNRSRPSTPRPTFPGEHSDGIALSSPIADDHATSTSRHAHKRARSASGGPPAESIFSKTCMYNSRPEDPCPIEDHPNHVEKYSVAARLNPHNSKHKHDREGHSTAGGRPGSTGSTSSPSSSSFPTSSTRTPTHSPPPPSYKPNAAHHPQYNATPSSRYGTFRDPRMAPNVGVLSNRAALPIAPGWASSAASASTSHAPATAHAPPLPNVGIKVPAGERGTGILVLRAVPDVYPPPVSHTMAGLPGMAGLAADMNTNMMRTSSRPSAHAPTSRAVGLGVATEVYPRDPDSAFLWGPGAGVGTCRPDEHQADEKMDVDPRGHW